MNEMIERVAKAIEEGHFTNSTDIAKAAIHAMREPTDRMVVLGRDRAARVNAMPVYENMIGAAWVEMIDAALK